MSQFNVMGGADKKEQANLIPAGVRLFCLCFIEGRKISKAGRGYFNLKLSVLPENPATRAEQPYANKVLFDMISDPGDADLQHVIKNGVGELQEKAKVTVEIAMRSLGCMLECAHNASPDRPESYNLSPNLSELHGAIVAVQVGIEEDKSGEHPDKNRISAYLSPNPNRQSHANFKKLLAGDHGLPSKAASAAGGFGSAPPAQTSFGGFGSQAAQGHAPPPAGPVTPAAPQPQPAIGPNAAPSGWLGAGQQAAQPQAQTSEDPPFHP